MAKIKEKVEVVEKVEVSKQEGVAEIPRVRTSARLAEEFSISGRISQVGIRVVGGTLFLHNGFKLKRLPVNKEKEINIVISQ